MIINVNIIILYFRQLFVIILLNDWYDVYIILLSDRCSGHAHCQRRLRGELSHALYRSVRFSLARHVRPLPRAVDPLVRRCERKCGRSSDLEPAPSVAEVVGAGEGRDAHHAQPLPGAAARTARRQHRGGRGGDVRGGRRAGCGGRAHLRTADGGGGTFLIAGLLTSPDL
ncbi:hypothetical protein T492DRAFT_236139 [Pavlovales sp. CCMP2436]|nr:hypothetical protein T492DRAFT_236139 [Pavlovales sp. CCMP2436]